MTAPFRRRLLPAMLLLCLLLTLLSASSALANGTPINVTLTYLPEISNSGPRSAAGVAEIVTSEGHVRLSAAGLPPLDGEQYVAWLVNTRTQESMPIATFNTDASSSVRLENMLPDAIPERDWNLVLVTIESIPEGNQPGPRRTIAGYFPEAAPSAGTPQQLPRTGGDTVPVAGAPVQAPAMPNQQLVYGGIAVIIVAVAVVAYGLGVSRSRR